MTAAEVRLWGTKIGTVAFDEENGLGSFEYDPGFLPSGIEVAPIAMPLSRRVYTFPELARQSFHGLPGLLADSLPDKFGNAVIDAWLRSQGRSPESFNPVERLCYTGNRGMGALEYVPARGPSATESESIEIEKLVQLASDILRSREDMHVVIGENAMQEIIRVGTSAGGARAKAVIAWNEKTGDIRSGQIDAGKGYEYWLIKFDGVSKNGDHNVNDGKQYTNIEYAYYLMAKDAGINMSDCRLLEKDGLCHFMTKRFDRENGAKLHMVTLAGLAHLDYNTPCVCSYEMYTEYARRIGVTQREVEEMYRRMVFAVEGVNCDDHVKNFSFLMNKKGEWHISPAYDITFAYNPDNEWISKHQMTINGKSSEITDIDMITCGKKMGLEESFCKETIDKIKAVVSDWVKYAEKANISENRTMDIALVLEEIRGTKLKGITSEQRQFHLKRMKSEAKLKDETAYVSLGTQIKDLCEGEGITPEMLARTIGIKPSAMKSIVNDKRVPSPSTISKVAEYFHVAESSFAKASAEIEKQTISQKKPSGNSEH
jgi:serine/threonine-protein kinase HipA